MPNISKIVKGVAREAKAKFKPAKPPVKPMTKTVISYDKSTGVKLLKPGSRPRTQSATELAKVVERSKTKTPAARASIKSAAKQAGRNARGDVKNARQGRLNSAMREAWEPTDYRKPLTPAQIKAGNKALAAEAKALKAKYAAAKKAAVAAAKRAAAEERRAYIKKYGVPKKY